MKTKRRHWIRIISKTIVGKRMSEWGRMNLEIRARDNKEMSGIQIRNPATGTDKAKTTKK